MYCPASRYLGFTAIHRYVYGKPTNWQELETDFVSIITQSRIHLYHWERSSGSVLLRIYQLLRIEIQRPLWNGR